MTAEPFVAIVGAHVVGRSDQLVVAQSKCVLNAPRGAERSLHQVANEVTGERWIGHKQPDQTWRWTKVGATAPRPDPERWPTLRRRADIDGADE